ncbi:unnamed protein product [Owenia fusiformis]|uniref:Tetratricopeptide repeat protein 29 n=1 Tax=Owenia fusiformis TaxID=6347 RepID=A0A8S4N785_OWEFU|nr:unnamed protein product [Owenia fusiformis]
MALILTHQDHIKTIKMAATLPAIYSGGGTQIKQSPVMKVPSPPPSGKPTGKYYLKPIKKFQGKKEKDLFYKQQQLRSQQPLLDKREAAQFRNTFFHTLCLDMLQEGFHQAFSELYALAKEQRQEREAAGPESSLWNKPLLEDSHEKLEMIKTLLSNSEQALRAGDRGAEYDARFKLARFFQSFSGDKQLSDHFFSSCLATSKAVEGDSGRMLAEGHCNVGLALEESENIFDACDNFEAFYKIVSEHKDWINAENETLYANSCKHLTRIYFKIGEKIEKDDQESSLSYLIKAYNMAKESTDKPLEGVASYKLGVAYNKNGDAETALLYLNGYLEICKAHDDEEGIGKACEAIAKAYENQGNIEESIRYLEQFVTVAERSKQDQAYSRACSDLGAVYNSLGRYDEATDYFSKSYNLSRALNDASSISMSRVFFGVTAAHRMIGGVVNHINVANRPTLERLTEWKNNRGDEFNKPIPVEEEPAMAKVVEEVMDEQTAEADEENKNNSNDAEDDEKQQDEEVKEEHEKTDE